MKLTLKNIKYILIVVIVICIAETGFIIKKNYGSSAKKSTETEESSSIDDINMEDVENLIKNKLIIDPLKDDFKLIQPIKTKFKTGEDFVTFMGMSDPKETLKVNDEDVDVYYTGNFNLRKKLDIGDNKFTFSLGDKSVTYEITREKGLIDYVTPKTTLEVDKNMKAEITARVYTGSKVYAETANQKVELKEVENSEELYEEGTSYATYKGYIDTSQYNEGQNLGRIKVTATLNEDVAEKDGPNLIISKKENRERAVEVKNDNAQVYDSSNTSSVPLNNINPLAKGTKDYIESEIKCDDTVYYNLASKKRIRADEASLIPYEDLSNKITSLQVNEDSNYVYLTLGETKKSSYTFFIGDEIKIYLNYATDIEKNMSYENNDFFENATFEEDNMGKYVSVKLKNKNSYVGSESYYDKDGKLVFRFLKKKKNLKDMKIVIDPGHGLIGKDKKDIGSYGFNEINADIINMNIARKLSKALEKEGCNTVLLYTDDSPYSLYDRSRETSKNEADMFISIHSDAGGSGDLMGPRAYYYTPYSEALANSIEQSLVKCYEKELFKDVKKNFDKGVKEEDYTVLLQREAPSVIVETGYINNPETFNKLIDTSAQVKISDYIVKGIKEYLG